MTSFPALPLLATNPGNATDRASGETVRRLNSSHCHYGRSSSLIGRSMLRCEQRCSCSVDDLLSRGSVRGTVVLCVRKRVTADQVRTAGLVQECTMLRDGLVCLPDAFTVGDFTYNARYLCTC